MSGSRRTDTPEMDFSAPSEADESTRSEIIMMVDDEPTTIEVLEAFLEGEGYHQFVTTSDSRQALTLLEAEKPDVLLLDLNMPHVGGLEILESIRGDYSLKHTPVIILSSTNSETKLRALELGATDFLSKPVDPSELALRLRNTLAAKAYQDQLAYYDGVTGIANRRSFIEQMGRNLRRTTHASHECAVLQVGLNRFKQVNDSLGHAAGDRLLKAVAKRLQACVRPGDLVARVGGDEFVLLIPGQGAAESAERVGQRIFYQLEEAFSVASQELFVTIGIGIALFPGDGRDVETLLNNASAAMAEAKGGELNGYRFYNESLSAESSSRLTLENQLRKALDRDELRLHYQPKIDVRSGQIIGAEALMRWEHPERGLVPPLEFIPLAETTGLIPAFGEWALHTACAENKKWQEAGFAPIRISVNVSGKQLDTGRLEQTVEKALRESRLDGRFLTLELTESSIMGNPQKTSETLRMIKEMGLHVSIDDFGTGYSSLSYLKRFPIDELKIDRSFVDGVPEDPDDAAIVTAIVSMAHSLGLRVVAEGVEQPHHLSFLKDLRCDEYQGYLFSRPLPAAGMRRLMEMDWGTRPNERP